MEHRPLGKFVVSAPGVCRGRPTFKYTRIEVAGALERLAAGHAIASPHHRLPRPSLTRSDRRSGDPGSQSPRPAGDSPRWRDMIVLLMSKTSATVLQASIARWYRGHGDPHYPVAPPHGHPRRRYSNAAPGCLAAHLRHDQRGRFLAACGSELPVLHRVLHASKIARGLCTSICAMCSSVTPATRSAGRMSSEM